MILSSLLWLLIACIAFSFVVFLLFRLGTVRETRDERGHLKNRQSFRGLLGMVLFAIVAMGALFSYDVLVLYGNVATFWAVLFANFIMILMLVLYDSFVIDLLVIGIFRPKCLHLPDTMDLTSMKEHVKRTFVVGWIYIVPLTLIPSILFSLLFL